MSNLTADQLRALNCVECGEYVEVSNRYVEHVICQKCEDKIDDAFDEALHGWPRILDKGAILP